MHLETGADRQGGWARLREWVAGFMFGAAKSWVMAPHTVKRRHDLERMFMLMTMTDLMGFWLVPPFSSQRMLPFVVPQILSWRRWLTLWDDNLELADLKHLGH